MSLRVLLVLVAMFHLGCDDSEPCTKDDECKGDRLCEMGVCVTPGQGDAGPDAADAAPTDATTADATTTDAATTDASEPDAALNDASVADAMGSEDASNGVDGAWTSPLIDAGDYAYYVDQSAFFESVHSGDIGELSNQIDASFTHSLPFGFTYFGTTYPAGTTLTITSNGTVWFGTASTSGDNTTLPLSAAPHGVIAVYWDHFRPGAGVFVAETTDELSIFFQYFRGTHESRSPSFELVLKRNTNVIELRYFPSSADGAAATIGLESPDGTSAVQLPCSPTCALLPGTIATFVPRSTTLSGSDYTVRADRLLPTDAYPNEHATITAHVFDLGVPSGGFVQVLRSAVDYFEMYTTADVLEGDDIAGPRSFDVPLGAFGAVPGVYHYMLWLDDDNDLYQQNNNFDLGTVTIHPYEGNIDITSSTLPNGAVGGPYSVQLQATGNASIEWSTPTTLPSGLTLSSSGLLSGTPTQSSVTQLQLRAETYGYRPDTTTLSLTIE